MPPFAACPDDYPLHGEQATDEFVAGAGPPAETAATPEQAGAGAETGAGAEAMVADAAAGSGPELAKKYQALYVNARSHFHGFVDICLQWHMVAGSRVSGYCGHSSINLSRPGCSYACKHMPVRPPDHCIYYNYRTAVVPLLTKLGAVEGEGGEQGGGGEGEGEDEGEGGADGESGKRKAGGENEEEHEEEEGGKRPKKD